MTARGLELVRSLVEGFNETDFRAFRDALAEARSIQELSASTGALGELMRVAIDPDVEIHLHGIEAGSMVGSDFSGLDGWLEFWRAWLEPWDSYSISSSEWEEVGDTVLYRLDISARGRGSGVEVSGAVTQAWTVGSGRVTRLGMYPSRDRALADLERG
jgi:hypothetical protein